jgi:hypothetical protein
MPELKQLVMVRFQILKKWLDIVRIWLAVSGMHSRPVLELLQDRGPRVLLKNYRHSVPITVDQVISQDNRLICMDTLRQKPDQRYDRRAKQHGELSS